MFDYWWRYNIVRHYQTMFHIVVTRLINSIKMIKPLIYGLSSRIENVCIICISSLNLYFVGDMAFFDNCNEIVLAIKKGVVFRHPRRPLSTTTKWTQFQRTCFSEAFKEKYTTKGLNTVVLYIYMVYEDLLIQCSNCHAITDNERLNSDLIEKCPYCDWVLLQTAV